MLKVLLLIFGIIFLILRISKIAITNKKSKILELLNNIIFTICVGIQGKLLQSK